MLVLKAFGPALAPAQVLARDQKKQIWAETDWLRIGVPRAAEEGWPGLLPFVVTELVAMVIRRDNVDE